MNSGPELRLKVNPTVYPDELPVDACQASRHSIIVHAIYFSEKKKKKSQFGGVS